MSKAIFKVIAASAIMFAVQSTAFSAPAVMSCVAKSQALSTVTCQENVGKLSQFNANCEAVAGNAEQSTLVFAPKMPLVLCYGFKNTVASTEPLSLISLLVNQACGVIDSICARVTDESQRSACYNLAGQYFPTCRS